MAADAEQCIFEIGEHPGAAEVNAALLELGTAAVKQRVIGLLQSGLTRDEINVMLQNEILPAFNVWLHEEYYRIMRTIHGEAPRHAVN
jgi:hypothetical protein